VIDDVLVIGAGPAGLAAALQSRRHGLSVRLCERARPGGLLWNANRVENYPGFPNGLPGPDLVRVFLAQAAAGGVEITPAQVLSLTWEGGLFQAITPSARYQARAAVVASGTQPRPLTGFQVPEALRERLVYEVAGLLDQAGKQFIIVGSGDAAFDYALTLGRQNSVIILNRGEQVKCLPLLWERAHACPNIDYRPGTAIRRLEVRPGGGMTVECSSPRGPLALQADYLVGAIGRDPHLDFASASLLGQSSELEHRGILHFVGDVKNGIFRQTAIAVGDGIRAGMRIAHALKELSDESGRLDRAGRHRPRLHR
jgi:thioredoxin reductase